MAGAQRRRQSGRRLHIRLRRTRQENGAIGVSFGRGRAHPEGQHAADFRKFCSRFAHQTNSGAADCVVAFFLHPKSTQVVPRRSTFRLFCAPTDRTLTRGGNIARIPEAGFSVDHAGSRKIKPNQAWIKQNAPGFSWITRDQAWIRGIKLGLSRIKHGSSLDRARIKQNTAAPGRVPLAAHIERSAPPSSPQLAPRARPQAQ